MTLACAYRHIVETHGAAPGRDGGRRRPGQDGRDGPRSTAGPDRCASSSSSSYHTSTGVPAEELADRCQRTLERAEADGVGRDPRRAARVARPTSGTAATSSCAATRLASRRCAGTCSSSPRPAPRPRSRASPPRASPAAATRATTSGTPRSTSCRSSPTRARTRPASCCGSAGAAAAGPPAGHRAQPDRRAVPVAHDQRRGGVGLLRRRHRPVPHQRGDRVRPQAVPRRQRRHRLPRRRGGRDPRRDGAPVGGPRLLRRQRRRGVPHPRRHRARRVHDRRQRQPVHERDGPLQHALRGAGRRAAGRTGTARPTPACAGASSCSRGETKRWIRAADAMYLPYDEELGIHPQDDNFLEREPWDFENTPADHYPLLLHYHPLVIYRHQVLKQADVVLAMVLRSDQFPLEQRRRNFDYYDPITTGDSSLSACVQAMAAAQIGYDDLAVELLPRGAVRRPGRHPRQRQRRRARRVGRRRVGHDRLRLRRAVRRGDGAAVHAEPAVGLGGRDVPHAAPRRPDARRARRRGVHGHVLDGPPVPLHVDGGRRDAHGAAGGRLPASASRASGCPPVLTPPIWRGPSPSANWACSVSDPRTRCAQIRSASADDRDGGPGRRVRGERLGADRARRPGSAGRRSAQRCTSHRGSTRSARTRGDDRSSAARTASAMRPGRVGDDPEGPAGQAQRTQVGLDDGDAVVGEPDGEVLDPAPGGARRRRPCAPTSTSACGQRAGAGPEVDDEIAAADAGVGDDTAGDASDQADASPTVRDESATRTRRTITKHVVMARHPSRRHHQPIRGFPASEGFADGAFAARTLG